MFLTLVRYGIPAVLIILGQVSLFAVDPTIRPETWAGFTGAGIAVLLLNILHRMGVEGDVDREKEDAARRYFDEHGHWPGEGTAG